jgi:hypothetical protein
VRTLESEVDDLKFVVQKLKTDLKRSEEDNTGLKDRLESAIAATYLPST